MKSCQFCWTQTLIITLFSVHSKAAITTRAINVARGGTVEHQLPAPSLTRTSNNDYVNWCSMYCTSWAFFCQILGFKVAFLPVLKTEINFRAFSLFLEKNSIQKKKKWKWNLFFIFRFGSSKQISLEFIALQGILTPKPKFSIIFVNGIFRKEDFILVLTKLKKYKI